MVVKKKILDAQSLQVFPSTRDTNFLQVHLDKAPQATLSGFVTAVNNAGNPAIHKQ